MISILPSPMTSAVCVGLSNVTRSSRCSYLILSLAYYETNFFVEAIESRRRALEIDPKLVVASNNICIAYVRLGKYASTIEACSQELEIDPEFSRAQANLRWARDNPNTSME
jgi:tetratricopeptide (TPR) repeat protein